MGALGKVEFGPFQTYSGTYTMNADCTGTLTATIGDTTSVFDLYASPAGDVVQEVQTSTTTSGVAQQVQPDVDTETRVSNSNLIQR